MIKLNPIALAKGSIPGQRCAGCGGDFPFASRRQAEECLEAARAQGLRRVRLGNIHLLGAG